MAKVVTKVHYKSKGVFPQVGTRTEKSSRRIWILKKKCTANVSSQIKRKKHGQLLIKYRVSEPSGHTARPRSASLRQSCWEHMGPVSVPGSTPPRHGCHGCLTFVKNTEDGC